MDSDLRATAEILEREEAITRIKESFEELLKYNLELVKVSSPLFVEPQSGLNDDLNGTERAVSFPVKFLNDKRMVIVHSLAKWKRYFLQRYGIRAEHKYSGIVTDMRAIRADEDYSPIHSIYVDQWDWEKVIVNRDLKTFKAIVQKIYSSITNIPYAEIQLPKKITFISAQELLDRYPDKTPKERETLICKEHLAVCIMGIGYPLSNGEPHDGRAIDYDDWSTLNEEGFHGLNGDILVFNPITKSAFELSSMGIRVNAEALRRQAQMRNAENKLTTPYHHQVLQNKMPITIGGGIGQSRLLMYLLEKEHIGEVQCSVWPESVTAKYNLL